jgi:2-dehydropantoate 2-reductase
MARVALIGPGAIGGTVAAGLLASGRHEVVICANQIFDELTLTRADTGATRAFPVCVLASPGDLASMDWVILAVKSHQTASVAAWLRSGVGASTRLAVLQNGVEHRARTAPFVPPETTIVPIVVQLPAERTAPGRIRTFGPALLVVADDEAGRAFAELFEDSFVKVQRTDDFATKQWEKLCLNAASGGLTTVTMDPDAIGRVAGMREVAQSIIQECVTVGRAEGAKFADDHAEQLASALAARKGNRGNSMFYDRRDGKPLEYDARNAVIGRLGRKHGIATPLNDVLTALLRAVSPSV